MIFKVSGTIDASLASCPWKSHKLEIRLDSTFDLYIVCEKCDYRVMLNEIKDKEKNFSLRVKKGWDTRRRKQEQKELEAKELAIPK